MIITLSKDFSHEFNGKETCLAVTVKYDTVLEVVTKIESIYAEESKVERSEGSKVITPVKIIDMYDVLYAWFPEFIQKIKQNFCWHEEARKHLKTKKKQENAATI